MATAITFEFLFLASGQAKNPSPAPTAELWRLSRADGTWTAITPVPALVNGRTGAYSLLYTAADLTQYDYWAFASTSDSTIDVLTQSDTWRATTGTPTTVTQDYLGTDWMTVRNDVGNPVNGVSVKAYLLSDWTSLQSAASVQASTTTDSNGNWTLSLPPNTYEIVAALGTVEQLNWSIIVR